MIGDPQIDPALSQQMMRYQPRSQTMLEWFRLQSVVLGSNGHRLKPVPPDAPRGKPDEL